MATLQTLVRSVPPKPEALRDRHAARRTRQGSYPSPETHNRREPRPAQDARVFPRTWQTRRSTTSPRAFAADSPEIIARLFAFCIQNLLAPGIRFALEDFGRFAATYPALAIRSKKKLRVHCLESSRADLCLGVRCANLKIRQTHSESNLFRFPDPN